MMTVKVRIGGSFLRNKAGTYVLLVFNLLFHYCPPQKLTHQAVYSSPYRSCSLSFLLFSAWNSSLSSRSLQEAFHHLLSLGWTQYLSTISYYPSLSSSLYCVSNLWLSIPPVFKFMKTRCHSLLYLHYLGQNTGSIK